MPHTHGFHWDEKPLKRLRELTMLGLSAHLIAEKMSKEFNHNITYDMVNKTKSVHRILSCYMEVDEKIYNFKEKTIPDGDYMISCDYHAPAHSEVWINLLLSIAEKFKIGKHIIIGDLFNFHFIKHHYTDAKRNLDKEISETAPVVKALDYFDENYLVQGNHERRIGIQTDTKIQAQHLFNNYGAEIWKRKFHYSVYDKMNIGEDWMVVHPKSYSQISGSVAIRLAEKFQKNVINSHGHFVSLRYTRDGKHMGVDLGGMFNTSRIDYTNLVTTTHPRWNNGFGMLRNGHFYLFHGGTDWNFWLNN